MPFESLRVALISEHASPLARLGGVDAGGQNVYVANVARCLANAGHQVDVFTRRDDSQLAPAVDVRPGLRVLHIPAGPARFIAKEELLQFMPAFVGAAHSLVGNSVGYDVVHANFFMSGWVGLQLKQAFGMPLVTTFHALGLVRRAHQRGADVFPDERIAIERQIVSGSDRLIAECPQDESDLVELYSADPRRIVTVPCGVDFSEFPPRSKALARRTIGLRDDEFVVLQLGRIVPRKGIDNVIRAAALLPAARNVRVVVVGGDARLPEAEVTPEIGALRTLAAELGIADRVLFVGHRQRHELGLYYAAADVFATTPWYEPFGITPLEAMASARPVVGSDVGGIRFSVDHGVTGFLVPPRDPAALAARLAQLQANPALADAMGRAGVRRVRSMFSWEGVTSGLVNAYLQAGAAHSRGADRRRSQVDESAGPSHDQVASMSRLPR